MDNNYLFLIIIFLTTVSTDLNLQPNVGSDRSWVYNTQADFSDGEAKSETFAIRFANTESNERLILDAGKFKEAFLKAQGHNAGSDKFEVPALEVGESVTKEAVQAKTEAVSEEKKGLENSEKQAIAE